MGLSVPGSTASAGNGRKERGRRRAGGRTGGGREEWKKRWREEEMLDDLTGLIRFLVPEGGLTKSPKSPEAACYPSDPGWSVYIPITESQATVEPQRENLLQ